MATESYNVIRLAVDASSPGPVLSPGIIPNVLSRQAPASYAGADTQFQIGLFANLQSGIPLDVSDVSFLQLDIKDPATLETSPSLFTATNNTPVNFTLADWTAGVSQTASFVMTNQQSNFALQKNESYVLIVSGVTNDSPGHVVVYSATMIAFWPTGLNTVGPPPSNPPQYYTMSQSDARYLQISNASFTWNQSSASTVWTVVHNMGAFPSITVVDSGGNVVLGTATYLNNNVIQINFKYSFAGKAYLNR
jgi:hypothetical protein